MNKFNEVKQDSDTKILFSKEIQVGGFDVLHEKWIWDGIEAQSYIFYNEDIKHLGENELLEIVGKQRTTYSKESIYTFVNFDFKT